MKSGTCNVQARLAAVLTGIALMPAYAGGHELSFKDLDANKDGYLSLDEFKDMGKDDLAFKAADIDGDGRIDPDEFDSYRSKKAGDQPGTGKQ